MPHSNSLRLAIIYVRSVVIHVHLIYVQHPVFAPFVSSLSICRSSLLAAKCKMMLSSLVFESVILVDIEQLSYGFMRVLDDCRMKRCLIKAMRSGSYWIIRSLSLRSYDRPTSLKRCIRSHRDHWRWLDSCHGKLPSEAVSNRRYLKRGRIEGSQPALLQWSRFRDQLSDDVSEWIGAPG